MNSRAFDPLALPLSGLQLIEASAGTGKTFNLAGLYLRLIVERHASVRDILVMTFTRAATKELRERIRRRLVDAALIASDAGNADETDPEHRFALDVLDAATDTPDAIARRLADAAAAVDEATIVTLHGFAQRAAADNAFDSALAFDRGENVDDRTVFAEAATDVWRRAVVGPQGNADLLDVWPTPDALREEIGPILARPRLHVDGAEPERLESALKTLWPTWQRDKAALVDALDNAIEVGAFKKSGMKTLIERFHDAAALVENLDRRLTLAFETGEPPVLPEATAALADPWQFIDQRSKVKKACAEPFHNIEALAPLADLVRLARVTRAARTAEAVRDLAETRKIAWRQFSYDDLVLGLHAALADPARGPRLAAALRAQWPYALVDEFQDTDPIQYDSLARIYRTDNEPASHDDASPNTALLLIGDPKQAIYAFRGGDIYAYLAASRAAGDNRYTLGYNFRSSQRVLDAIAALFDWPEDKPFLEHDIEFPPVAAGRSPGDRRLVFTHDETGEQGAQHPALTAWRLTGGAGTKGDDGDHIVHRTVAAIAALLAGHAAWQSHDPKWNRAVAPRDIAVLVNDNFQAATLQVALAEHGIAAVCQRRDSIFESGEAGELALLMAALANPDDQAAVRSAETTRLMGARLSDLIALADDDAALQTCITRYQAHHEHWQRRGILAALEDIFMAAAPRILALTDGERRMSNYLQLGELLAEAEPACYGMTGLLHWLDQQVVAAQDDDSRADSGEQTQLRLESDDALVRIATVHAAKGLEYPIVFMPYALYLGEPSGKRDPKKPPFVYHRVDSDEPELARIDLTGVSDPASSIARDRAVLESRSEALRLLYVALTRAADALFITWREPGDGESKNHAGKASEGGALHNLLGREGSVSQALAAIAETHPGIVAVETLDVDAPAAAIPAVSADTADMLAPGRTDLPAERLPWSSWSFSRLAHSPSGLSAPQAPLPGAEDEWRTVEPAHVDTADDTPVPMLDRSLAGVGFGSAVHDLLEYAVLRTWPAPGATLSDADRRRTAEALRRYGLIGDDDTDARIAQTADVVARALHTSLPTIGPLAAVDKSRLRAEMGFLLGLGDQRLGVVLDAARAAGYLRAPLGRAPGLSLNGLLQGFIDLIVEVDGAYWIIDYKTNRVGDTVDAYRPSALAEAISASHYDLQYLLYVVALHRHLRRCLGEAYNPAQHLGGVQYLFVRAMGAEGDSASGIGVFSDRPDPALIETLDALFDGAAEAA